MDQSLGAADGCERTASPGAAMKGPVLTMAEAPCCGQPRERPGGVCETDAAQLHGGTAAGREIPGYRLWPFVEGWAESGAGPVPKVRERLGAADVLGRWQMRWGIGRHHYRIAPGLYAVGEPGPESPVLVTANYKMTFDVLRRDVTGLDAWILVLETRGINVWCAAGKGTFGTAEVVRRVGETRLAEVVSHRQLLLPQLAAPGVAAHEVKAACAFSVVYGPIRALDIRAFLAAGMKATPAMRRVTFTAGERLVLTPVELVMMLKPAAWAALALLLLGGLGPGFISVRAVWERGLAGVGVLIAALLAGAVLTPVLLPWIPGKAFSAKGALVGVAVGLVGLLLAGGAAGWLGSLALLLALPAGASYVAMNFTGATPFTSPSGVEREMRRALPLQAIAAMVAGVLWLGSAF